MFVTKQVYALQPRVRILLFCLVIAGMGFAAWIAYDWYAGYQGKKAQLILSDCLDEYQRALESEQSIWPEVVIMNDLGHEQVQVSSLKPYFLVMQAQAMARQGKVDEAVAAIDQAITGVADNVPFKDYFRITKSLMQLDVQDSAVQEQGLSFLQELADNDGALFQDVALYYLSTYYSAQGDAEKAAQARQRLLDGANDRFKDSPWAAKLIEKFAA